MTALELAKARLAERIEQVEVWRQIETSAKTAKYRKHAALKARELDIAADELRGLILAATFDNEGTSA